MRAMPSVTLLGPQVREPNLSAVLRTLRLPGPFVSISAGWQEREGEVDELRTHIESEVQDLRIYQRTEELFATDRDLRIAHRQRQIQLQEMQQLYALQLTHAKNAARELFASRASEHLLRAARRHAISALRRLDRAHLAAITALHAEFERTTGLANRVTVRHIVAQLRPAIDAAAAVLIAGGHVAVLANRLRLLGGAALFKHKPVIAWSAGAMTLAESVVLFHDDPPQGAANAEVFDAGLGLVRRVLPLPHAQQRLFLHDETRLAIFARRFAPHACVTLDAGSWMHFDQGQLHSHGGSFQLSRRGVLTELA